LASPPKLAGVAARLPRAVGMVSRVVFERDAGNCHRYPPSRWRRRASGVFVRCWSTGVAVSVGFGLASPLPHAFAVVVAAVGDRGGAGRRYFPRGDAPTQPWRLTAALASPRP